MNDVEFWLFKSLKLKHSRGDQIIQPFYRIDSSKELNPHLFKLKIFWKFEQKALLNQVEYIEIWSMTMNWNLFPANSFK